jgi:hypothetical protein
MHKKAQSLKFYILIGLAGIFHIGIFNFNRINVLNLKSQKMSFVENNPFLMGVLVTIVFYFCFKLLNIESKRKLIILVCYNFLVFFIFVYMVKQIL